MSLCGCKDTKLMDKLRKLYDEHVPYDIQVADQRIQEIYFFMRAEGNSPRLAEMLTFRQAPQVNTDDTWFARFGDLEDQFKGDARGLKQVTDAAKQHGYTPNPNDVYYHGLAAFPGDPKAFINQAPQIHIRKVAEQRGHGSQGLVNVKAREPETDPLDVSFVADDISDRIIRDWEKEDPDRIKKTSLRELREEVNDKHAHK